MTIPTHKILKALARPFPADAVSWRVGQVAKAREGEAAPTHGRALAYIDARDCEDRLDDVMGACWQTRHEIHEVNKKGGEEGVLCVCHLSLLLDLPEAGQTWVSRSNGSGETDFEGQKGAMSKAFVRASSAWGIGRYLYAVGSPKVKIQSFGRSHTIDQSEQPKLRGIIERCLREYDANPRMRPMVHEEDAATSQPTVTQPPAPIEPTPAPAPLLRKLMAITEATRGEEALLALAAARQDRTVDPLAAEDAFLSWLIAKCEQAKTLEPEKTAEMLSRIEGALGRASLLPERTKAARVAIANAAARRPKP